MGTDMVPPVPGALVVGRTRFGRSHALTAGHPIWFPITRVLTNLLHSAAPSSHTPSHPVTAAVVAPKSPDFGATPHAGTGTLSRLPPKTAAAGAVNHP